MTRIMSPSARILRRFSCREQLCRTWGLLSSLIHPLRSQFQEYPAGQLLFRKIAVIYYLTKDWRQECHPFPALDSVFIRLSTGLL